MVSPYVLEPVAATPGRAEFGREKYVTARGESIGWREVVRNKRRIRVPLGWRGLKKRKAAGRIPSPANKFAGDPAPAAA